MSLLRIKNLEASIEGKKILKGINLEVKKGEIVVIMGPNGSGKSTLANVLMGNPAFQIDSGEIKFNDEIINDMAVDERSRKGLFLSFQYPYEVEGVTLSNFLRTAINARREKPIPILEFKKKLKEKMSLLEMDSSFMTRYLNKGFSGGEKKRAEILQLSVLEPTLAILDETDSGLDIDALKIVSAGVMKEFNRRKKDVGFLIITHYQRLLQYIKPHKVHVMIDGLIVKSGGPELAEKLEKEGYQWI